MNIHYAIHTNFMGTPSSKSVRKLVSLSEYKGPVLVLTPEDEAAIFELQSNINNLELDLYKLEKLYSSRANMSYSIINNILSDMDVLRSGIADLREQIRKIKIERFNAIKENQGSNT